MKKKMGEGKSENKKEIQRKRKESHTYDLLLVDI